MANHAGGEICDRSRAPEHATSPCQCRNICGYAKPLFSRAVPPRAVSESVSLSGDVMPVTHAVNEVLLFFSVAVGAHAWDRRLTRRIGECIVIDDGVHRTQVMYVDRRLTLTQTTTTLSMTIGSRAKQCAFRILYSCVYVY
ncbi:hypothetical protein MTO96_048577 [Rhipicephalus appendiculatus]